MSDCAQWLYVTAFSATVRNFWCAGVVCVCLAVYMSYAYTITSAYLYVTVALCDCRLC